MRRKRTSSATFSFLFLFGIMFIALTLHTQNFPIVFAQEPVYYRGSCYETWTYADGTVKWVSAWQAVWNGTHWVDYTYSRDDGKKCYRVQSGLIAAEIYDTGVAVFFDVNFTEQRVKSEVWEVWDVIADKKGTLNMPITFSVTQNASGVFISAERTTSKPKGLLTVAYSFRVGRSLKHYVYWRNDESTSQTTGIQQVWDLAGFIGKCDVDGVEKTSGEHNGTRFLFYNTTNPYLVFEDQTAMFEKLQPTSLDVEGKKVTFTFGNWTLENGQELVIDPATFTNDAPIGTGDVTRIEDDTYTNVHDAATGTGGMWTEAGNRWIGQYWWSPNFGIFRSLIAWSTSPIPDSAVISAAKISIWGKQDNSTTNFKIRVQNWTEAPPPANTLDYDAFDGVNYDDGNFDTSAWALEAWNNITLTNFAIIDVTGGTYVMFRSDREIASTEPTGYEWVQMGDTSSDPILEVTYNYAPTNDACDSDATFTVNVDGWVNLTVSDGDYVANLNEVKIQVNTTGDAETFTLNWTQTGGAFAEVSDTSNICTLSGSSVRVNIDADTDKIAFYFKFTGGTGGTCDVKVTTTDDDALTDVDTYSSEFTFSTNVAPTITSASISDRDDADNCYEMESYYSFVAVVNDEDGATDIEKVYIQGCQSTTVRFEVRATSLTGTPAYSIQTGSSIIDLDTGSCTWAEDGNAGTTTFKVRFEWDFTDENALELRVYVEDSAAASAGLTTKQTDYFEVLGRLVTSSFATDDARINLGGTTTLTGTVYYATQLSGNTASAKYPLDAQFTAVHIHNSAHASQGNDASITNGAFSVAFAIPSAVQSNTYHVYLDLVADYSDTDAPDGDTVAVIGDRIHCTSTTASDNRDDINDNVNIDFTLKYDYDETDLTDGTVTIEGFSATNLGVWRITRTSAVVTSVTYNEFTATGNTHGITAVDMDGESGETVIWDEVIFKTATLETTDAHINLDATGEWYAELMYDFDDTEVTDGLVTLNTDSMSWDSGDGRWEYTNAPASVTDVTRNIASISGNTHGITELDSSVTGDSETIEYDQVVFQTGTFDVTDDRIDMDATGEWYVKLMLDNNNVAITAGTITLNTGTMSYDGTDSRWEYTNARGSIGTETRNVASVSGITGGITAVNSTVTGDSASILFDGLKLTGLTSPSFLGSGQYSYKVKITYASDDSAIDGGVVRVRHANGQELTTAFTANSTGWATIGLIQTNSSAGTFTLHGYSEPTYGIAYKHTNQTFIIYTFNLQGRDAAGTNLPRFLTYKITVSATDFGDQTSSIGGLKTLYVPAENYTVNTWWGDNDHLIDSSRTVDVNSEPTTSNIDTKTQRLTAGSHYLFVSINATTAQTIELVGSTDWEMLGLEGTGTVEMKMDVVSWIVTTEPNSVSIDGNPYETGWTWDSTNKLLTWDLDLSETAINVKVVWQSDGGAPTGGGSTTVIRVVVDDEEDVITKITKFRPEILPFHEPTAAEIQPNVLIVGAGAVGFLVLAYTYNWFNTRRSLNALWKGNSPQTKSKDWGNNPSGAQSKEWGSKKQSTNWGSKRQKRR